MKNDITLKCCIIYIVERSNIEPCWWLLLNRHSMCLHSSRAENKQITWKPVLKHDYCHVKMPDESNKILTYTQDQNALKTIFVLYANKKSLPEKVHICQNNLERSLTWKIDKYVVCGHSIFMQSSFDVTKNIYMITLEVSLLKENKNNEDKSVPLLMTNHEPQTKDSFKDVIETYSQKSI